MKDLRRSVLTTIAVLNFTQISSGCRVPRPTPPTKAPPAGLQIENETKDSDSNKKVATETTKPSPDKVDSNEPSSELPISSNPPKSRPIAPSDPIADKPDEPPPALEADTLPLSSAKLLRLPTPEGQSITYISDRDLTKAAQTVDTVIIVVHGIGRNAKDYFASMRQALIAEKSLERSWVIAPQFMQADDKPMATDLIWEDGNWREGSAAIGPKNPGASSFAVLDQILSTLNNPLRFSKLKAVYLVGFSAGGQFMQRYLLGTKVPDTWPSMRFRFVVGAPGSYMYVTADRRVGSQAGKFQVPTSCPEFNDYRYGIQRRNEYLKASESSDMIARLKVRDIRLMAGSADTSRDGVLDVTCAADLQGKNRYDRMLVFGEYLKFLDPASKIKVFTIPGVSHDHDKVFLSLEGRKAVFSP